MEREWGGIKRECKVGRWVQAEVGGWAKLFQKRVTVGCREDTNVPSTPTPQNLCQKVVCMDVQGQGFPFLTGGADSNLHQCKRETEEGDWNALRAEGLE